MAGAAAHPGAVPLHIEALLQAGRREEAKRRLAEYETLMNDCQTPRCEREIVRLKKLLDQEGSKQ